MFGKRTNVGDSASRPRGPAASAAQKPQLPVVVAPPQPSASHAESKRSEEYYVTKSVIFGALIEAIDLAQLSKLDAENAREEIRDIVNEIIAIKNVVMSIAEQEELLDDICNDVLGYGPLEPLLARDDIADIMVNGALKTYIEVGGKIQLTNIRFRDNAQLMNICQRIVSQVGRRVDDASPICDARLLDGSRVNVIAPPLAIDGPALTIRKFKKDKLTLDQLIKFGSISPEGGEVLKIIGRVRCNVLISGGTGSGKTTLLNCMTNYIDGDERVITCEDAAELQLQQPHVVRLETRPPNLEGQGAVTMRDLVKNCLRMRPERIIVGEVRGPEAFDLLQAMNTGHDGSMGTLHANSPREALGRLESMITMGGFTLPARTIRDMIVSSIDVIIQAARLRDGSRRITHVTEVMGLEGDTVTPVSEASFFSIVINIQQKAGGNLSETLSNLSRVLRERKKMKAKIQAMSSEAKASAGIIGSLPFLVAGAVYLTTPSYMMLLFSTTTGNLIIGGCLLWMSIGVFIMSKMINFDI